VTFIEAIIFGAVQGITEFLPVSSSGHLVLLKSLFELDAVPILFDVILHVATLLVVLIVFRRKIAAILLSLGRIVVRSPGEGDRENGRLFLVILVATAATALVGYAVSLLEMEGRPKIVSILFCVTGLILIGAHFLGGRKDYGNLGAKEGLITGVAQGIGVFPGISRSGITISASLLAGLSREKAGEFAFLISIPAILGAFVLELGDLSTLGTAVAAGPLVTGFAAAFLVGLLSLLLLLRLIRRGRLFFFAFYLIPLGVVGLIFL
jgi:undecaprenyl-diphosphatase